MLLVAMLMASILIQAATNMFNEHFDYVRGLDTVESVGIAGAFTQESARLPYRPHMTHSPFIRSRTF
jgi:1,4-dihydroxy-2-naphthoate octaprenyltransferase